MSEFAYDRVPYRSHAYVQSTPDNMATLATLFGMHPAPPDRARVLEIGCAAGGNLAPLALLNPGSTYLGIDYSAVEIAQGQELAAPFGLDNLELRHMDVAQVDDSLGQFDYIVCHGVYSWVPVFVRDKILEVCSRNLAPHGVAYVSYNTYPGWHMRGMIRDMMVYHTDTIEDPERKVRQARALLDFLAEAHPQTQGNPYSILLRREADTLRRMSNSYLFHDHLSEHNDPVYFHEFIERVVAHDLAYLGESQLHLMLHDRMPDQVREVFAKIAHDQIKTEQYMDFVRNRMFRESLLVHDGVEITRQLDWRSMRPFRFGCRGTLDDGVLKVSDDEVRSEEPVVLAAFAAMIDAWPKSLAFEDLLAQARASCQSTADIQDDRVELGGTLLRCFASSVIDVRITELPVARAQEHPKAFEWARRQATLAYDRITNARHESGDVDQLMTAVIRLCDGERNHAEILDGLVEMGLEGSLAVYDDGVRVTDREKLQKAFSDVLPRALALISRMSLVVE